MVLSKSRFGHGSNDRIQSRAIAPCRQHADAMYFFQGLYLLSFGLSGIENVFIRIYYFRCIFMNLKKGVAPYPGFGVIDRNAGFHFIRGIGNLRAGNTTEHYPYRKRKANRPLHGTRSFHCMH
jgi:hypothetical protein